MGFGAAFNHVAVHGMLKENVHQSWQKAQCDSPEVSAGFVAAMDDVLDFYEPYDEKRPVVCFDESTGQLIAAVRQPLPPAAGSVSTKQKSRIPTRNAAFQSI